MPFRREPLRSRSARRGDALYVNDGVYGSLSDAGVPAFRFPVRALRASAAPPRDFAFFGPTCDSADRMAGPFALPGDIGEVDLAAAALQNGGGLVAAHRVGSDLEGRENDGLVFLDRGWRCGRIRGSSLGGEDWREGDRERSGQPQSGGVWVHGHGRWSGWGIYSRRGRESVAQE